MTDCVVGYVVLYDKEGSQSPCIHTTDCLCYRRYLETIPNDTSTWSTIFNTIEEAIATVSVNLRFHHSCLLKIKKDSCLLFWPRADKPSEKK